VVAGTADGAALGAAAYGDPAVPPGAGPHPVSTIGGTLPSEDLILHNGKIRTFDNHDRTVSAVGDPGNDQATRPLRTSSTGSPLSTARRSG
jgi:hypothetical protein